VRGIGGYGKHDLALFLGAWHYGSCCATCSVDESGDFDEETSVLKLRTCDEAMFTS